jgi:hypothetical protein
LIMDVLNFHCDGSHASLFARANEQALWPVRKRHGS